MHKICDFLETTIEDRLWKDYDDLSSSFFLNQLSLSDTSELLTDITKQSNALISGSFTYLYHWYNLMFVLGD